MIETHGNLALAEALPWASPAYEFTKVVLIDTQRGVVYSEEGSKLSLPTFDSELSARDLAKRMYLDYGIFQAPSNYQDRGRVQQTHYFSAFANSEMSQIQGSWLNIESVFSQEISARSNDRKVLEKIVRSIN